MNPTGYADHLSPPQASQDRISSVSRTHTTPTHEPAAAIVLMSADAQLHHQVSLVAAGLGAPLEVHPGLVSFGEWPSNSLVLMDGVTAQRYAAQFQQQLGRQSVFSTPLRSTWPNNQRQGLRNSTRASLSSGNSLPTEKNSWGHRCGHREPKTTVAIVDRQSASQAIWKAAAQGGIRAFFQMPQQQKGLTAFAADVLRPKTSAQVLAVTAITPQSGATTLAKTIAATAPTAMRCVLIDADPVRQGLSSHFVSQLEPRVSWENAFFDSAEGPIVSDLSLLPRLGDVPTLMFRNVPQRWNSDSVVDTVHAMSQLCDLIVVDLGIRPWSQPSWRNSLSRYDNWSLLGVSKVRSVADLTQAQQWSNQCPIAVSRRKAIIRPGRLAPMHEHEIAQELDVSGFHALPWHRRSNNGRKRLDSLAQLIAQDLAASWPGGSDRTSRLSALQGRHALQPAKPFESGEQLPRTVRGAAA